MAEGNKYEPEFLGEKNLKSICVQRLTMDQH